MKNIIDLFSGVGGLSLGAVHANLDLVGSVELDRIAHKTHRLNFPDVKSLNEDILNLQGIDLLNAFNQKDIFGLIGGPPCQGFSAMGKQAINDPRNQLFIQFFRLVKQTQPVFYMAENVKGILHNKFNSILEDAFSMVEKDYDMLEPIELNAKKFGVPTSRPRVFFIGIRRDIKHTLTKDTFLAINNKSVNIIEAFEGLDIEELFVNKTHNAEQHWISLNEISHNSFAHKISLLSHEKVGDDYSKKRFFDRQEITGMVGTRHTEIVVERYKKLVAGQVDRISRSTKLDPYGICPTLRAGTSSEQGSFQAVRPIHPFYNRVISPREAARIQGFPDWFLFHPTKWHSFKQIGNSVSPIMAKHILEKITKNLEES